MIVDTPASVNLTLDLNFSLGFPSIPLTSLILKEKMSSLLVPFVSLFFICPLQCLKALGSGMDFSWVGSNSFHCLVSKAVQLYFALQYFHQFELWV